MPINTTLFDSQIVSSDNKFEALKAFLKSHRFTNSILISDEIVYTLHGKHVIQAIQECGLQTETIILPAGEKAKNLANAEKCWTKMHALHLDRNSLVIGMGGGVITDLSGFVASCYMRGIKNVQIPTTLMAMVDASIGGKTAVNLPEGKNMVGTFHQPSLVLIAPHFLESLPPRELHSGLAEVIKCAVIWDEKFFHYLEENLKGIVETGPSKMDYLIERTAAIKIEIVGKDEKEQNLRAILNWGHTFAHALETITHYNSFSHGEAVSIGMCCAALVSKELGYVDQDFIESQERLCIYARLPTRLPDYINIDEMIRVMQGDKKSISGKINLILARKIGHVEKIDNVDPAIIKKALKKAL